MKPTAIILSILVAGILCSCEKNNPPIIPYNDPPATKYDLEVLLEAYDFASDYWTTYNQFSESLLYGKIWGLSKCYYETYVDGELIRTLDDPFDRSYHEFYFDANYSMRFNNSSGVWQYINNHIIMRHDGSFYDYEVSDVTQSTLRLKHEERLLGSSNISYSVDKSGRHAFCIREYQAK